MTDRTEGVTTGEHRLLAYRVEKLEEAVSEIRDAVQSIDKSLQLLSLVESQHVASRLQIKELEERVKVVEKEMPTLKLARKWVLAAITSGGAAVGAGVVALMVK